MGLKNYYTVYRHISPSNKSYIGVTREIDLNKRWMNGNGYVSCPLFYNAIKKYGWDNFQHEILEDYVSIENVNEREKYWISLYKSNNRDYGYNIEDGGHAHRSFSEATRKKISEALKGRPKSEEHKQKLRESNLGYHHTLEARQKMSKSRSIPIEQLDKNNNIINTFSSIKLAAETLHLDASTICKCCKGKQKTCGGFHWRYKEERS